VIKGALDVMALEILDREIDVNPCFYKDIDRIMADTGN
jgi:hypothetical protein